MCRRVREEICKNLDENLGNLAEITAIYRNLQKFVEIWENVAEIYRNLQKFTEIYRNLAESAGIC
jgi:Fe2+ or Zn2+ uptake regulation protein